MENTSVSRRLSGLLQKDSPLMKQAETRGLQAANRRGLMNSSMGVQAAEAARLDAALPIASQEAQQAQQSNLQRTELTTQQRMQQADIQFRERISSLDREAQERIASMNVAASERQAASQLAANFESSYSQIISNIMANPELPSNVRQQLIRQAQTIRDSNLALVEQMYGIELEWETAPVTPDPTNLPLNLPPKPWEYPVIESPWRDGI